jgi:hypothetical protein
MLALQIAFIAFLAILLAIELIIRERSGPRDVFNSPLPRLFAPSWSTPWAITLGQTTYYSVRQSQVDAAWRRHEDCHKRQWQRDGRLRFLIRYLWQLATKGYNAIDYEVEARAAAASTNIC